LIVHFHVLGIERWQWGSWAPEAAPKSGCREAGMFDFSCYPGSVQRVETGVVVRSVSIDNG